MKQIRKQKSEKNKEIRKLIKEIKRQGVAEGLRFSIGETHPIAHQNKSGECGIYCLYFNIHMIKTGDPTMFKKQKISEAIMKQHRGEYFNID